MMRIIFFLSLFLICLESFSCDCIARPIDEEFAKADLVMRGKVISRIENGNINSSLSITYRLEVRELFKGVNINPYDTVSIFTSNDGSDCGEVFRLDSDYLIFSDSLREIDLASAKEFGPHLYATSMCRSNSLYTQLSIDDRKFIEGNSSTINTEPIFSQEIQLKPIKILQERLRLNIQNKDELKRYFHYDSDSINFDTHAVLVHYEWIKCYQRFEGLELRFDSKKGFLYSYAQVLKTGEYCAGPTLINGAVVIYKKPPRLNSVNYERIEFMR